MVALEEHEFCDGTLYRHVPAADDASLLQMVATIVSTHLDSSLQALTDIDNHLTILRTLTKGIEQPWTLRCIARTKSTHHDGLQIRRVDDVTDQVFTDARKE